MNYYQNNWNICYIEFNNCEGGLSHYKINDLEGTFYTKASTDETREIYVGGWDNHYFHGVLARFDFFSNFLRMGKDWKI